MQNNPYRSKIV